jgi:hypothetical protein
LCRDAGAGAGGRNRQRAIAGENKPPRGGAKNQRKEMCDMEANSGRPDMAEIARRAAAVRRDPGLRHRPNAHDLGKASENARAMQAVQFQAIAAEGEEA